MPLPSIGEREPDVTSPPSSIAIPCRGIPFSSMTNATSFSRGPSSFWRRSTVDAGELLVERARPAEPRLDRRSLRRDVVSVERVADLEPKRVARAETAREDAALEDRVPEARRVVGVAAELAAALPRVARARDEAADAEHVVLAKGERLDLDLESLERFRALHGEQRPPVGDVLRLGERRMVGVHVRCVHDEQVVVVRRR